MRSFKRRNVGIKYVICTRAALQWHEFHNPVVFHNIRFRSWFKFSDGYLKVGSSPATQTYKLRNVEPLKHGINLNYIQSVSVVPTAVNTDRLHDAGQLCVVRFTPTHKYSVWAKQGFQCCCSRRQVWLKWSNHWTWEELMAKPEFHNITV